MALGLVLVSAGDSEGGDRAVVPPPQVQPQGPNQMPPRPAPRMAHRVSGWPTAVMTKVGTTSSEKAFSLLNGVVPYP